MAPILVAADGGADVALAHNLMPDAVIGDLDSIAAQSRKKIPPERVFEIADQDSTDFEKCLQRIAAPLILALGFTGARLDHTLAACSVLTRYPETPIVLVGEDDICFLAPAVLDIDLPVGTVFSIFPMGHMRGRSDGLKYPIDGLDMAPGGRVGTSNEVTGPVRCRFEKGRPLVMVPHEALDTVIEVLVAR